MRAITIKCPECGAVVNAQPTDATARCAYCGVTSQIRGRSRVLQIPRPAPVMVVGAPRMPVATAKPNPLGCIVVLAVIAAIAVPIVLMATKKIGVSDAVKRLKRTSWDGVSRPVIVDVNGDSMPDIVGRARILQPTDIMKLAAYDGASGKRLWASETLGPRGDWLNTPMGYAGGTFVISDGKAGLVGIAAADGSTRWRIRVNEVVKQVCAGEDDATLTVFTADKKAHAVTVADGSVVPSKVWRCVPVPNDDEDGDLPDVLQWNWHNDGGDLVIKDQVDGVHSKEALYYVPSDLAIGLGHKRPGSRVPMIVAYRWPETGIAAKRTAVEELRMKTMEDFESTREGRATRMTAIKAHTAAKGELREMEQQRGPVVLWTAVVPGVDPLTVKLSEPDPEHTTMNKDYVAVVYETNKTHVYRLTAFRLADGTRAWDVELPGTSPMSAVTVSPTHALVSRWDGLYAFDLATGERSFTID